MRPFRPPAPPLRETPLKSPDPSPVLIDERPKRALAPAEALPRDQVILRGGLMITAGIITGNISGFVRVALTAYLLGTHSRADSLAVAIGPIDTLNLALINAMVFAFVPMLTERQGAARTALFLKLNRLFAIAFTALSVAVIVFAPWIMRLLAPGLAPEFFSSSTNVLRILALSTMAAGSAAIHSALLYTDRRFGPSAFYQPCLNVFTIACALLLWRYLGVFAFAIGYTAGSWVQFGVVYFYARRNLDTSNLPDCEVHWRDILTKPGWILAYATVIASNITFTRAWATHAGPGMAAGLDYCMRGVAVPFAFLVSPLSNSLLPEIARLRARGLLSDACRLIEKTIGIAALAAIAGCTVALVFRKPAIELLFQRGSFTADSTLLVSAVFLGFGPAMIGWSLLELTSRSLFALDRPHLPVIAAFLPVLVNVIISLGVHNDAPVFLGLGASTGFMVGFLFLFLAWRRRIPPPPAARNCNGM